jgi:hypothetical protein
VNTSVLAGNAPRLQASLPVQRQDDPDPSFGRRR